jgi:hypothetical protein
MIPAANLTTFGYQDCQRDPNNGGFVSFVKIDYDDMLNSSFQGGQRKFPVLCLQRP